MKTKLAKYDVLTWIMDVSRVFKKKLLFIKALLINDCLLHIISKKCFKFYLIKRFLIFIILKGYIRLKYILKIKTNVWTMTINSW